MRTRARKDTNQEAIVKALREVGASVFVTNNKSLPDLVVGFRGVNYLMEVKNEKGKLTPDQIDFFHTWEGQVVTVRTPEFALDYIKATRSE